MMIYSPTHDGGYVELQWLTEFGRSEDVHKIQAHKGRTGQADVVMRGEGLVRQAEWGGGGTPQSGVSPRLSENTEISFVVHRHSLTWLSYHKMFAWKMRAAERSEPTEADREEEAGREGKKEIQREWVGGGGGGGGSQRLADFYCTPPWYVFKVQNDTSYHYIEGSGACQLLCSLTPSCTQSDYHWHTSPRCLTSTSPPAIHWNQPANLWLII